MSRRCIFALLLLSTAAPLFAAPTLTTLVAFDGSAGQTPSARLIGDSNGNLYGTAVQGGPGGHGTVFQLQLASKTLSTLAAFNVNNGAAPLTSVTVGSDGNFYGTTHDGQGGYGRVFEISANSHTLTPLTIFNFKNGGNPESTLVSDAAGNLYGTTNTGGTLGSGTLYEIAAGTHAFSTLNNFYFGDEIGGDPTGDLVVDSMGDVFGTTGSTIFEMAATTHAFSILANVPGNPLGVIADSSGNLFGTTSTGGPDRRGSVFEFTADTHTLLTLATFSNTDGGGFSPAAGLLVDDQGNLFGTTSNGGAFSDGIVFEVHAGTHALSTLATFDGSNGADPTAALFADANGNLFGTTRSSNTAFGTIFELSGTDLSVPEPGALSILFIALPMLIARRRATA